MKEFFIIIIFINFIYFLFFKRRFDFYSLAYLSSIVYFMPAFFGFDLWHEKLSLKVYFVYILFEIILLLFAVLFDLIKNKINLSVNELRNKIYDRCFIKISIVIVLLIIFIIILKHGFFVFFIPKTEMGINGKLLILWRVISSLLFIYGFIYKYKTSFIIGLLLVILTFISGDRTTITLSILAIFLIKIFQQGEINFMIKNIKLIIIMSFFSFFILIGKLFQSIIYLLPKYTLIQALKINFANFNLLEIISKTEPFIIQMILNKVVIYDYRINDPGYILYSFFQLFPINLYNITLIGYPTTFFNDYIQQDIFTMFKEHTIAYNFWAEGYALSGILGVILFILLFNIVLFFYNLCLYKCKEGIFKLSLILMGVYHVFYIHRNSLYSIISYEKQIFYYMCIILFICYFLNKIKRNF